MSDNHETKNKRLMVTLSSSLIDRMEKDIRKRGLTMTKSTYIELAIEHELNRQEKGYEL